MSIEKESKDWKSFYTLGGISAIILGISYIIITILYVIAGGTPPNGGEAELNFFTGHMAVWWVIVFLSVLTDILFLPVALSLYLLLEKANRIAMMVGSGLLGLFALLDLTITWPNYSALITLSSNYAASTSDVQKISYISAANYASAVLTSHFFPVYAILLPALGILLISLVMLKGTFSKITAYLGLITGILGIISVAGPFFLNTLGAFAILTSVFTLIWVLLVGYKLLQGEVNGP